MGFLFGTASLSFPSHVLGLILAMQLEKGLHAVIITCD